MTKSEMNRTMIALGQRLASSSMPTWECRDIMSDIAAVIHPLPDGTMRQQNDARLRRLVATNYGIEAFDKKRARLALDRTVGVDA